MVCTCGLCRGCRERRRLAVLEEQQRYAKETAEKLKDEQETAILEEDDNDLDGLEDE